MPYAGRLLWAFNALEALRDWHACPFEDGDRQELAHHDPEDPQCRQLGAGQILGTGPSDGLTILRCTLPCNGKNPHQPKTLEEICQKSPRKPQAPKRKKAKFEYKQMSLHSDCPDYHPQGC